MNKSQAFCDVHKGSSGSLDESCGRLTRGNCDDTSCCVWTSNQKCAAGGIDGPTFNSDVNGKTKQLDITRMTTSISTEEQKFLNKSMDKEF